MTAGLAAFSTPPAPPGWEGARGHLIRIVDPLGGAIAWLAPDFGANCVGYAVRSPGTDWMQVFHSAGPDALRTQPDGYGCAILTGLPGQDDDLPDWQFIERDPTAALLGASLRTVRQDATTERVQVRLTARLDAGALSLDLEAHNRGAEPVAMSLGMQPTFATGLLDPQIHLGGARTHLRDGAMVNLAGSDHRIHVTLTLTSGIRTLRPRLSTDQQAVSLALFSYNPAEGPIVLPAGARVRIAVSIDVEGANLTPRPPLHRL